ncbi:MAG: hypothetical protein WC829_09605 [Hyphomicrobium sp.]
MAQNPAAIAIGQDDANSDWNLRAGDHAEELPPEAGPLKRVLEHDAITQIMGEFSVGDAKAVAARARYQRIGRLSLYAATLATVIGALFLLPIEAWLNGRMAAIASMLQVLSLVVAFLASRYLVGAKPLDIWMKSRAQAEIARIAYFEAVTDALEPQRAGELPLLPLALEYFRRYQLDVQRRYYKGRAAQHAAAMWRNNRWLRAGLLVTVISVVVATLLAVHLAADAGLPVPPWLLLLPSQWAGTGPNRISLALGVVASALYGLGVARSLMDLDERNASRYATTSGNLEYLVDTGFAAAQAAATDGNAVTVKDFITQVHNQISSEHREWILLSARNARPDRLRHG